MDLAGSDREAHAVIGHDRPEPLGYPLHREEGNHRVWLRIRTLIPKIVTLDRIGGKQLFPWMGCPLSDCVHGAHAREMVFRSR